LSVRLHVADGENPNRLCWCNLVLGCTGLKCCLGLSAGWLVRLWLGWDRNLWSWLCIRCISSTVESLWLL